jgi:cephalosporin-C deacetylase-like acetyl esterase
LEDIVLAKQEEVRYQARDGLEIQGVLVRPLEEQAGVRYPLIMAVHGGPESCVSHGWVTSYSLPGQVAAAEGMAVFYPNYRGSTGTYEVYSTSRHAIGIDDSGTMQFMVRFAHGERAAIGFHDIPVDDGKRVQTRAELGTPQSHGCIRQARPDARALWSFAIVGTTVVVTA